MIDPRFDPPRTVPETTSAAASPSRVVLFDFDGVISVADTFGLFIRDRFDRSLTRKLLALATLPWLLLARAVSWKLPVRTLVHIALLGTSERRYRQAAQAFAAQLVRRPRQFNRDALAVLRRHQANGERVIVVTGCEHTLVRALLDELGLAEVEVVASQLAPRWIGMRSVRHNVGRRKLTSLAEFGVTAWQRAYGDSPLDIPMLKAASEPVLVNGSAALCKRVEKALGRSVERVAWY